MSYWEDLEAQWKRPNMDIWELNSLGGYSDGYAKGRLTLHPLGWVGDRLVMGKTQQATAAVFEIRDTAFAKRGNAWVWTATLAKVAWADNGHIRVRWAELPDIDPARVLNPDPFWMYLQLARAIGVAFDEAGPSLSSFGQAHTLRRRIISLLECPALPFVLLEVHQKQTGPKPRSLGWVTKKRAEARRLFEEHLIPSKPRRQDDYHFCDADPTGAQSFTES
jgi:hypothetical protein